MAKAYGGSYGGNPKSADQSRDMTKPIAAEHEASSGRGAADEKPAASLRDSLTPRLAANPAVNPAHATRFAGPNSSVSRLREYAGLAGPADHGKSNKGNG